MRYDDSPLLLLIKEKFETLSIVPSESQAGALLAGLVLADVPNIGKAVAVIEPLTCLFGGMYLGSLGMILSPVRFSLLSPSPHIFFLVLLLNVPGSKV